jgi:geranylgeranyl transferase type-1 subunit beta
MCDVQGKFYFGFCSTRSSSFFEDSCQCVSNLASAYSALAILKVVLTENFDLRSILEAMRNLQMLARTNMPIDSGPETYLRFVYRAATISLLNDWSEMDGEKAKDYIIMCHRD